MSIITASVYIICCNEERHIGRVLENVKKFAEVILVDSGSTDQTLEIAKRFPNVTIYHQNWLGYAKQKAYALEKCTNLWVLNLDADEELSDEFKQDIKMAIATNACDALSCPLSEVFLGKAAHKYSKHADKIRFFKRTHGSYNLDVLVHESIFITGKINHVNGVIYHYGLTSIEAMIKKNNEYSTLAACAKFARHKRANILKMVLSFFFAFFRAYFLKRFFLNGTRGFIHSMSIGFYAFLKEAKLYELEVKARNS
jgi:glycosyltransferase involved in cell wall biosynthesis